jgi:hypothetical protein
VVLSRLAVLPTIAMTPGVVRLKLPKGTAAGMNPRVMSAGPQQIERPHPVPRDTRSIITSPDRTGSST